jgi:chromosome segregation ATPase
MDMTQIVSLIGTLGFPIVACLVMGWFIFKIYKNTTEENAKNMEAVQKRCLEREERLNEQIAKCQEVNAQAIATIAVYTERLGIVEQDVKDIKEALIRGHN